MSLRAHYENQTSEEIYRRVAEAHLYNSSSLCPPLPAYDPIFTPLLISAGVTGSFAIGATTITYASIISAIATTALSIGVQMLFAPKPPKPEAAKVPLQQAIPYRFWGVGRTRSAGALMLWESFGPNLFAIQAFVAHRIKSFNRFWLHDDEVVPDSDGYVAPLPGKRYGNSENRNVRILHRLGLAVETAYAPAVAAFGASGLWTNDHRGDGQASLMMSASANRIKDQNKTFPYGIPSLSAEADLALCWDFRDPEQDPNDPSTWTWTQNSAIICAWHLCFNEFGFRLNYRKALMPVIDLWIEEADICDEDVSLAGGGTEKRYQCNGTDSTENGPKTGLNAILASCDGHLVARGDGARILTVGKFRESRCVTLTDADIVGHNIQYDVLFEEECNRLIPKFTYPATSYTTTDTDFFEDSDAQVSAGRVLAEEANYQWVHQWRQARRLGKRDWLRLRQKVKGSIDVRLSGVNAVYARWARLATPLRLPRLNGKIIENRRAILALTRGGYSMDVVQHPDNIDDWNPAIDEGVQPPVPTPPDSEEIVVPVVNLVQAKPNGESVYIRVVIIDPEDGSLTPIVRYRLADNGTGSPGAWVEQKFPDAAPIAGFIDLNTNVVPSNQLLDVQVSFETSGGGPSDWSPTVTIVSTVSEFDTDAEAIFAAMTVAPNNTRKRIINNMVLDLKAGGIWSKLARLAVLGAHSEQAALLNWKSPAGTAFTKSGTISYAADRGFTSDGTTGFLDSGAAYNTLVVQNDASMWAWVLTNVNSAGGIVGTTTTGGSANIVPNNANNFTVRAHGAASTIDAGATSIGLFGWSRSVSTGFNAYRNKTETAVTQTSTAIPTGNLAMGRAGTGYNAAQAAFVAVGASLTTTQQAALYDAVQAYMKAIGAI